jgi:hypothetical protein
MPNVYTVSNQIQGPFSDSGCTQLVTSPVTGVLYYFKWTTESSGTLPYSVLYDWSDDANWYWIGGAQQNYQTTANVTVIFSRSFATPGTYTARMHIYAVSIPTNGGVYYV